MTEREGVIKYRLDYTAGPALEAALCTPLSGWRAVFCRLGLVGQDPHRYGGLGFGNLSCRLADGGFLITGTQTGALTVLGAEHYCRVEQWKLGENFIRATGPVRPSSEALTHAAVYQAAAVDWVMHVHSPELWQQAAALELPVTDPAVAYGTPAMAVEVQRVLAEQPGPTVVLAMGGHEDGVIALGEQADAVGGALVDLLARALRPD